MEFRGKEERWWETVMKVRQAAEKTETGMGVSKQLLEKAVGDIEKDEQRLKKIIGELEEDDSKLQGTAKGLKHIVDKEMRKHEATIPVRETREK